MAQYIFDTDGSYVNFNGGGGLWRLARASNCIAWRFDETGDLFFDVYDQQYIVKAENIAEVVIDGVPLAAASDFPDAITAVFTGIGSGGASYLVYVALLSQTGTNAPTAVVLENTLRSDVTWFYSAAGQYYCQLDNPTVADFPFFKTWIIIKQEQLCQVCANNSQDYIQVITDTIPDLVSTNGFLAGTSIEIRVYP